MPHTYDKQGIRFLYPDNWTVDEGEPVEGGAAVTVYSPGGSFWSIVLEPHSVDPAEMAIAALRAIKAEYEDCDAEPMSETVAGHEISGYDASFFCLDLISTAAIRGFRTGAASCLVLWQAEDRDLPAHEPVFRAMIVSLLSNDV
jgi:hypothetical protein